MRIDRLDTPKGRLYKALPLWLGLLLLPGGAVWAEKDSSGAQLPDGAEKVGENRYRAREDFDGVLKYYKTVYPAGQYPRKAIVNQPGVKAVHIVNPLGKPFEGLNIYQANDEVRIYVIPSEAKTPRKKAEGKPKGKS